jgi:hypothetical protein
MRQMQEVRTVRVREAARPVLAAYAGCHDALVGLQVEKALAWQQLQHAVQQRQQAAFRSGSSDTR